MISLAKNNEIIKELRKNIKFNKLDEKTIVDDLFALSVIVKYNIKIDSFFYCSDYEYRDEAKQIKDFLINKTEYVYSISSKTMETLLQKKNSSYLIAIVYLPIHSLNEFKNNSFLLIADGIELPGNMGTIFRTIDAVKCEGLISINSVTKLNNPALVHSSRGMNLIIPQLETSYEAVLSFLIDNGFTIYLGEPKLGISYNKTSFNEKIAIVIGSERYGIKEDWYNHPHEKIFIPMYGEMTSLNVGVAASILLYKAKETR